MQSCPVFPGYLRHSLRPEAQATLTNALYFCFSLRIYKVKMKAYSLFIITICCIYRYTSVEIKPKLKKNILKFDYDINYKYERMLAHSFDRFCVITKFILPTIDDLKFSKLKFDNNCECL